MNKKDRSELSYWRTADLLYHRAKLSMYLWAFGHYKIHKSVLEIGPGPLGGVLPLISRADRRIGIDPLANEYKKNGLLPDDTKIILINENFEHWQTDEHFDAIFSIDSLDHGEMTFDLVRKIASLLNPGGRFYLHVHLRPRTRLNECHDHQLTNAQLTKVLLSTDLIELKRDFYEEDIDGAFDCKALVGVWEKPCLP